MVGIVEIINSQKINSAESLLNDCSTEELFHFVLEVKKRFENGTIEQPSKEGIFPSLDSYYTMGIACRNILKEREGKEFFYNLMGIKKPKTLYERIKFRLKEIYFSN